MLFVLEGRNVVVLPVKLDNSVIGRYLSLQDNEFVDCVVSDIKQFVNRSRKSKSVLVFPPVNNYRRFLIHKVSEKYPEELCTFSIGQGHGRRTVVCFKRDLLRDLHQTRAADEPVSATLQPVKRFGTMGVEHQHLADQAGGTPSLDNSVKRARAVPPVGIYRPPAARRLEQIAPPPAPRSSSPAAETKPERTRPARQRRPDIQVYIPRPKRLSAEGQDRVLSSTTCTSANKKSSNLNLRPPQNLHFKTFAVPPQKSNNLPPDKECKSKVTEVELHTILPSSDYWFTTSSCKQYCGENDIEVSDWTESTDQLAELNCHVTADGSKINCEETDVGEGGVMTHQFCAENVQSVQGKKGIREMEKSQIRIEGLGRGRRNKHGNSDILASGQSGHSTPTSLNAKEQVLDYNGVKSSDRILNNAHFNSGSNCQETNSESVSDKQEFNGTHLVHCEGSESVKFTENFVDEVCVDQGLEHRSSSSFSSDSMAEYGSQYRPSSITNNGVQARDYYSEIKNARNSSQDTISGCDIVIQNPCSSVSEDIGFVSKCSDVSVHCDVTRSSVTTCDDGDQFLMCSDTEHENTLHCGNSRNSNVHDVTSLSDSLSSIKHIEASEDRTCNQSLFVADECHKKDENNECQVQEEQIRTNKKIMRGNLISDVLIISDPDPVPITEVMAPSTQIDCSSESMSLCDSALNEEKSLQPKPESVSVDTSGPDVNEMSGEKHESSSSSRLLPVNLNPDECTWDMLFDDDGECLDPKLMEELTNAVGSVTVEKPQSDYRGYQSRVESMSGAGDDEFSHVIEIYNFPSEFKTNDLCAVFSPYMKGGFEIKWVDDTHALGVFSSPLVAAEVLAADHPFVKTRPLHEATPESRMKARRSAEFLQPYRARPETCVALARRLVGGALGVKLHITREEREAERKLLKEAREKKRLAARQRDEAWEGTLGEN